MHPNLKARNLKTHPNRSRIVVHTLITRWRGIGQHYHAFLDETDEINKLGQHYAKKFDNHFQAVAWIHKMCKLHFPVKRYRLINTDREGPWFYRSEYDDT